MTENHDNDSEMNSQGKPARSLADMVGVAEAVAPSKAEIDAKRVLVLAAVPAIAFLCLHFQLGQWLIRSWQSNSNWSHGPLIPLFSAYLIYARWDRLEKVKPGISWFGLLVMIAGVFLEAIFNFTPLRNYSLSGLAMVITLFGLVLYLSGWRAMKYLWLPVLFTVFAIPMSGSAYTKMAYPLQELAAFMSVGFYKLIGVEIIQAASSITLISESGIEHKLTVAEACSGMNLLVAFVALAVAIAYLEDKPVWQRFILVFAGVPIAVLCNVLRVIITCFMYYIDRPELGQGILHSFTGMLMLVPAFGMLWLLGWLLKNIFVESASEEDSGEQTDAPEKEAAHE